MKHNLMSIGQLIQNGYKVLMENDKCVIHEKDGSKMILASIQMTKNRMFPLKIETRFSSQVSVVPPMHACTSLHQQSTLRNVIEDLSKLRNLTYEHLGFAGLNLLYNKRMVDGFPNIVESCDKSEASILGKQHIILFNYGNSIRERAPLELVHSNLVGPMQTNSIGGVLIL